VIQYMKEGAVHPCGPADSYAEAYDAHVFDAAVGEKPFEVVLDQDEYGRKPDGYEPEDHQEAPCEHLSGGGLYDGDKPHDPVERRIQENPGEERADGARGLAVRVRKPVMHRSEPGLGAVSHKDEDESEFHGGRVQFGGDAFQHGPVQCAFRPDDRRGCIVGDENAEQGEGDPHGAEDDVFPCRLDGQFTFGKPEADQQRRDDGRRLDGDPHQGQIVCHGHQNHGEDEEVQESEVSPDAFSVYEPDLLFMLQVPDGIDGGCKAEKNHQRHHVCREGIHVEDAAHPFHGGRYGGDRRRDGEGSEREGPRKARVSHPSGALDGVACEGRDQRYEK